MNVDKNAADLLKSYVQVCENHSRKLNNALLKTSNLVPITLIQFKT